MPSEEEFDNITQMIEQTLGEKKKSQEEAMQKKMLPQVTSSLKYIPAAPVGKPAGYFIAKGTEILIPVDMMGKKMMSIVDFKHITTTKDVKYDPDDLVFDRKLNLSNLIVEIGVWADEMVGFRLPPNDKEVEFFLVLRQWVDILQDAGYNDRMKEWLEEVVKNTSDSMDISSIFRGL